VAQVPSGVTTGNVVVTAAGGVSSNGVIFKVLNPGGVAIDQIIVADGTTTSTTRATASFSTSATNELLLAFISSGKGTATTTTVSSVAGASLTWVLVQRTNTQQGTAEIWRAFAPTALSKVTVTATFSQSVQSSMTVVSFTGIDTTGTNGSGAIGAIATANAASGAPSATLTTTRANSVVFGVGDDPTAKVARTLGANQSLVHQLLCSVSGQTCTLLVQQFHSANGRRIQPEPGGSEAASGCANDHQPDSCIWADWHLGYCCRLKFRSVARHKHRYFRRCFCNTHQLEQYKYCCAGSQRRSAGSDSGGRHCAGRRNKQLGNFHRGLAIGGFRAYISGAER
jgi:hypothetical protein